MGDLLAILSSAQTSLNAQRGVMATASHNIDNSNNPNYSRQVASVEALVPADYMSGTYVGRGSTLGAVTQVRNRFLESQLPAAFGNAARGTAESDALQAFHALDPGAGAGLDSAISTFYSSMRALAQNPADSGARTVALGAANALAQAFNRTAQQVDAARTGLDAQLIGLVATINGEAKAVADLNLQIRQASAAGGTPNDLLDLRQQHLDRVAQLTGATPVQAANGDVNLLVGGLSLVSGSQAATLSTQPDPANDGHLQILFTNVDGTSSTSFSGTSVGGSVGGTLSARDGALLTVSNDVDQLAHDLAGAINTANGYDPVAGTGSPVFSFPLDTTDLSRTMPGTAAKLTVPADASIAPLNPAAPGDATVAQAIIATESGPMAGASGVQNALSAIVSRFGAAASTAKAIADQDGGLKDQLVQMRDSASGVSTDDEMISIQTAQRAYEAIAKVITAADSMMQTLMDMIK
jgi:flagellar hook-associated protein 1 FlgK